MLQLNKYFRNENDNSVVQFKNGSRMTTYNSKRNGYDKRCGALRTHCSQPCFIVAMPQRENKIKTTLCNVRNNFE